MTQQNEKIGLLAATSLIIGNMIGAGIFVLPASLGKFGSISILGWILTASGALVLAKIFSNFSKILKGQSGGPYIYSKVVFGDFIGFLVAWGYWISCWINNAAIAVAIVSALSFFIPELATNSLYATLTGLFFIWLFTYTSSKGFKSSGNIQIFTTIAKLIPLIFIIIAGLFVFDFNVFPKFNITDQSDFEILPIVCVMTLYAFLGIECASIPAENIKNPEKNIPKATMIGTIVSTIIYIFGTVVLFGVLPTEIIINSPAPFAEAGEIIGGKYAGYFVSAGAAISAIGALNGWILITSYMPMTMANDKLFPQVFKKKNKKGFPIISLLVGSILTSFVMTMNFTEGLVDRFEFLILLTTLSTLIPYLFVSASYILYHIGKKYLKIKILKSTILGFLGLSYSLWAIFGSGIESIYYGSILLLIGIPFYYIMKIKKPS
ncbi:MAG: amino acid permease [Flavobacteriaceae bacterium]|jgi:basic amino acid/polyamine antiporter, APA family|nr:amino acid permease [Flavobacteriaceae bacterium]MBT6170649.1 amino acid permease [Flavobacteriaceae bacterium]MBT6448963.1 amino acid permease [Flavobacteriaceae bacterium]MBT7624448.1 amino acid permease [Flavobacteriaceae bacterium]